MPLNSFLLFLLLASLLLPFTIHIMMVRLTANAKTKASPQVVALIALFLGFVAAMLVAWNIYLKMLFGQSLWAGVLYTTIVYWGFAYAYFHFFNLSETARRINILSELLLRGALDETSLKERFSSDAQIQRRLERLQAMGQIKRAGDKYILSGRSLWIIGVILMRFRKVLRLDR